jgi:hypothetical protein
MVPDSNRERERLRDAIRELPPGDTSLIKIRAADDGNGVQLIAVNRDRQTRLVSAMSTHLTQDTTAQVIRDLANHAGLPAPWLPTAGAARPSPSGGRMSSRPAPARALCPRRSQALPSPAAPAT